MAYAIHILIAFCLNGIAVLGLNLALGITGLVHLGYVAIIGTGAYASALLLTAVGVPFPLAVLAGVAAGAIAGWLIGLPTREIRGDTFALATFAAAWVFLVASLSWVSLTGGPQGVVGIPRPPFARANTEYLLLAVGALIVTSITLHRVAASPFGRVLTAIRDDEVSARVFGKRTIGAKRMSLAIAGAAAGLSGALWASFLQFINPTIFWIPTLLLLISAVIIGGVGHLTGSLIGLAVLTAIGEGLRFTPLPPEHLGALRLIIAALLILLIVMFRPRGLFGRIDVR